VMSSPVPESILQDQKGLILNSCRYTAIAVFDYVIWTHHENILRHFEAHQETLDLAPRGCGKSRIATIAYCFWRALRDPNIRILIVSDTDRHAVNFLATIKNAFEFSPIIKKYFGDLKGDKWSDHAITLAGRTKILTEPTISAHGASSGAVTSGHYDIIIADDLVTFDNALTEGKREKMKEWFVQTLLPTRIPGGEIHVVGTRYHFRDLYQKLIDEMGYHVQVQAAIQEVNGEEVSIWEDYMPLEDRILPGGKVVLGLKTIRETGGTMAFNLQYQNDVELMKKGIIFQFDWFRWFKLVSREGNPTILIEEDNIEIPLSELEIYMGVDPAVGEKETNDYFVICVVGVHRKKNLYFVLDIVRDRPTYEGRRTQVKGKADQWGPRLVGLEDVAFQKDWCQSIRHAYPHMRVKEFNPGSSDKTSREWSRSGLVENRRVYVRRGFMLFVDEMCQLPDAEHDDQFDAFDWALEAARAPRSGMKWTRLSNQNKYDQDTPTTHKPKKLFDGLNRPSRSDWNEYS
jgi:phage terminase large subunit-like protein